MARFILSRSKVIEQYNRIRRFGLVSYSLKTNPLVGKVLEQETDSMFSVHFINELKWIKDKKRVWFLTQGVDIQLLNKLFSLGIDKFIVDNLSDLTKVIAYINKHNKKIWLMLRLKLKEHTLRTQRYYVFGIESRVINKKILELRKNINIKKLGVHMHRKTQNVSEWNLKQEIVESLNKDVIKSIDFINIGGGIPSQYKNITDTSLDYIFSKIKEISEWTKSNNIQLIIEPGRFIAAPSVKLETKIIGINDNTIIVDASVYNSSLDTLIVPIKLLVEDETNEDEGAYRYLIKGITPCSMDIFRYRVYFKKPKKVGDKIVFINAGAYNFHSDFCSLDVIKTEIVE